MGTDWLKVATSKKVCFLVICFLGCRTRIYQFLAVGVRKPILSPFFKQLPKKIVKKSYRIAIYGTKNRRKNQFLAVGIRASENRFFPDFLA